MKSDRFLDYRPTEQALELINDRLSLIHGGVMGVAREIPSIAPCQQKKQRLAGVLEKLGVQSC